MNINPKKINSLIKEMEAILRKIRKGEEKAKPVLKKIHSHHKKSALNLVHYHQFRKSDFRESQRKLGNLGMTRFANAQGHVEDSLVKVLYLLYRLADGAPANFEKAQLSTKKSKKLLKSNTQALFGNPSEGRRVRIMVTMPSHAAKNYALVYDMVENGMNCARINCAHDTPEVWKKIIKNVKKASEELGSSVKIAMDLAGPKIRTGAVEPGARIIKFKPKIDDEGIILKPVEIRLIISTAELVPAHTVPINADWLGELVEGDKLSVVDANNKSRKLKVIGSFEQSVIVRSNKAISFKTGAAIESSTLSKKGTIGSLPQIQKAIRLYKDDMVVITDESIPGSSAIVNEQGEILEKAHIPCQFPGIFEKVNKGDLVLFDDGKIEGIIQSVKKNSFEVLITRAAEKGVKLKAEKGMNFPNTNLGISGLTPKDKEDLAFVAKHADIVNFSFVNSKKDVQELLSELKKLEAYEKLGIILKIETKFAFDNLEEILLEAMQVKKVGVMIARGDLAVETGWQEIGQVQHELLSICGAAHIPVIWATQVLENLAKNGLPSRSEITDVVTSLKAECVMLNKGPYMKDVLILLDTILSNMEDFQEKNETMLPKIRKL
ncbi:pyruvate kinase [Zobellia laminariae]|uniref:pyruvate kinase n=1 Tax=Zobellia laminariae TaxID=248906 RepID=UPI003EF6FA89